MVNIEYRIIEKPYYKDGVLHVDFQKELYAQDDKISVYSYPLNEFKKLENIKNQSEQLIILDKVHRNKMENNNTLEVTNTLRDSYKNKKTLAFAESNDSVFDIKAVNKIVCAYTELAEDIRIELRLVDKISISGLMPAILKEYSTIEALAFYNNRH